MAARRRLGWVLALGLGMLAVGFGPGTASADEGTVRLRDGGVVSGTIEIYEPGLRVVIRTASGEVVTLTHDQIAELQISPSSQQASTQSTPPPPPPGAGTPTQQPNRAPLRQPSMAAPPVLALLGTTALVVGVWLRGDGGCDEDDYYRYEDECEDERLAGAALLSIGASLAFVGLLVVLPIQIRKRTRHQETFARQLTLSPGFDPLVGRYGLVGTLRF